MNDSSTFNTLNILQSVYNNSLEDDDTKIYMPISNINVQLRRHQYAVVDQMKEYEKNFKEGFSINNDVVYSKYAILGDNVGVGKTLMVLSHIASLQTCNTLEHKQLHKDSSKNFYSLVKPAISDLSNVGCLIIVPHTLFRQWQKEIETKTSLKLYPLKTKKEVWGDKFMTNIKKADIILVSNTLYKDLYLRAEELKIRWKRIYIDEADTIELVSTFLRKEANTYFTWLISASYINLLFPQNYFIYISNNSIIQYKNQNNIHKEFEQFISKVPTLYNSLTLELRLYIRSSKFINEIISSQHPLRGHTIIRCSKDFINKSISLPQLITLNILCKPSISHSLVYDVINSNIRQLLNAGDTKSALEHLGVKTETNTNLIEAVNESKLKELDRLQKTYEFKQSLEYSSEQIKESALKNLKEKIDHIQEQMKTFKERVENYKDDVCPICYDEPNDALITCCCSRIFCASCILQSLSRNISCPLCRTNIHPSKLKKLSTENIIVQSETKVDINEPKKKLDAFMEILQKNPEGKFLVFSRFDNSFIEIRNSCIDNGITTKELKGSKDMIASTLNNFKEGKIRCLLMNTIQMGAGLNITEATHVILLHSMTHEEEKQILGRAYRVGRTKELYFIKLVYPDEH